MVSSVPHGGQEPVHRRHTGRAYGVCAWCGPEGVSAALLRCLEDEALPYSISTESAVVELPGGGKPDAVLVDLAGDETVAANVLALRSAAAGLPTIAVMTAGQMQEDLHLATDDFVVLPWRAGELTLRIQRLVSRGGPVDAPGTLRVGDLVIDTERYDVYLAGKPVVLTFKEYQLLKLLASNPRRVYTRAVLLEQVWGYEYFGGTRTVDVHVRRLRSKIEDANHTFVDTVWNVGYRFRG